MATKKTEATYEGGSQELDRLDTGLYSLNWALGGGLPLRTITEISGWEWSGKTTLSLYLTSLVRQDGLIGVADLEPLQGLEYVKTIHQATGFHGKMKFVDSATKDKKPVPSEKRMDDLADLIYDPACQALLLDSVGAIYSVGEEEGKTSDAHVGERARLLARHLRKIQARLNTVSQPVIYVFTNHVHEVIGGRGTVTSGGKAVMYYSASRFRLTTDRSEEGLWIVNGKMIKRRYWGKDPSDTFQVAIVPGEGVHIGLSAVLDCLAYGIAKKDRTITLGSKSFGFLSKLIQSKNDTDLFKPFKEALAKWTN